MPYRFQTISKAEMSQYKDALMEFFGSFGYPEDYSAAIDNSAFICVCWFEDKIIGGVRALSDLSRFAFIVDLNVKKLHQNKGNGKQLVTNIVQACLDAQVRYIELSTDANYPWLEDFYTKIGFSKVTYSVFMEWPRR